MFVARILYPIEVLGPGKRVGIWFAGCPRRCRGCSNPELWEKDPRYLTTPETVADLVFRIAKDHKIDGFTFTGGDPMMQYDALMTLIPLLAPISRDVLVYTGAFLEELPPLYGITALIDGEYREEENLCHPLIGSMNQRFFLLDEAYRVRYRRYLKSLDPTASPIQNFHAADGHISVGIHRPAFLRTTKTLPNTTKRKDNL
ncbi:MAG: radical SAM protein [Clostridia bacterium]|nr:radical SAM protein [Clostridia bacterium]